MAIPREAAPATVLPKSNLAQLGYQITQQRKAEQEAKRKQEAEQLAEVSGPYFETVHSPIVMQAREQFMQLASDAAADPKNRQLQVDLARAKNGLKDILSASAAMQKQYDESLKFIRQNPDGTVDGAKQMNDFLVNAANGDYKVELKNGNFLVNGELALSRDDLFGMPQVRKAAEVYTVNNFVESIPMMGQADRDGNISVPSASKGRAWVEGYFDGLDRRQQESLVAQSIINDYVQKYGGAQPSDEYVERKIVNEFDTYYNKMIESATNSHLGKYKSQTRTDKEGQGGAGGFSPNKANLTLVSSGAGEVPLQNIKGQIGPMPKEGQKTLKDAGAQYGLTSNEFVFIPNTEDKTSALIIENFYWGDSGKLFVTGRRLQPSVEQSVLRAQSELQNGSVDSDIINSLAWESMPIEPVEIEGEERAQFIAALKKAEPEVQKLGSKYNEVLTNLRDIYYPSSQTSSEGAWSSFN